MKRTMILGLIALTALLFVAPSADAHPRKHRPRAAKVVVVVKPAPVVKAHFQADTTWVAGHWVWRGASAGHRWVPGHWTHR